MTPDKYSIKNLSTLHPAIRERAIITYTPFGDVDTITDDNPGIRATCGLRNQADQETAVRNGKSRAHYPESYHNWGFAFDFLILLAHGQVSDDFEKYKSVVDKFVDEFLKTAFGYSGNWRHGKEDFYELGHMQFDVYQISSLKTFKKDSDGYVILENLK